MTYDLYLDGRGYKLVKQEDQMRSTERGMLCGHCGERIYDAEVAEQVDDLRDSFGNPDRIDQMHVYDFARMHRPTTSENLVIRMATSRESQVTYAGMTS